VILPRMACQPRRLLLLILAVSVPAAAQMFENEQIAEVRISGNALIGTPLIRSHLRTRPDDMYSGAVVRKDVEELFALGYFTDIKVDVQRGAEGLVVTYIVTERPVIEEISLLGNDKISDREIRETLRLRETDTYTERELREDIERIIGLYAEQSYPTATVDAAIHPVAPGKVHLVYTIEEGYKSRVRRIDFVGNAVFTDKELRRSIRTKKRRWLLGGSFDQDKFDADLDLILALYGDRGYVDARITGTDMDYRKKGRLYIVVYIEEGPQYRVGSVTLTGNHAFLEDELTSLTAVHADDVFDRGKALGDIARGVPGDPDRIERFYIDNGYIYARVTPQVRFDREKHLAHVTHAISERGLMYVAAVDIIGNVKTKDEIIRRRLAIRPGDRYNGESIRRSIRNVRNLGYFKGPPEPNQRVVDDQLADLVLRVEESDTGRFNFGGGVMSDEGLFGFLQLQLNNFDIADWPTFSGGGQTFSARLQRGTVRNEASVGFTDPYFLSYPLSFGVDLYTRDIRYYRYSDFEMKRVGGRIRFGKWFTDDVRLNLRLRAEQVDIHDIDDDVPQEIRDEEGTTDTMAVMLSITRDTRDYFLDPHAGSRLLLSTEVAGGPFGGDADFVKVTQDGIWFWSFFNKLLVLSVQERLGFVEEYGSSDRAPLFERFFVGGATTVRGYQYRDIGPKSDDEYDVLVDDLGDDDPSNDVYETRIVRDPIGGKIQAIGNIELGWRLNKFLGLYTFADGGTSWWDYDDFDLDDFRYSVGLGLGIITPMGPMRFDYGFPVNPDDDQGNGRLHFSTGLRF